MHSCYFDALSGRRKPQRSYALRHFLGETFLFKSRVKMNVMLIALMKCESKSEAIFEESVRIGVDSPAA